MRLIREKVIGVHGDVVVKGRVVEFNTAATGLVRRAELTLTEVRPPGQPPQDIGWSAKDIERLHKALVAWCDETGENP